jgi:hypothetical protein
MKLEFWAPNISYNDAIKGCKLDTHGGQCVGDCEGGVYQRPFVVTADPVLTVVPVRENMEYGADFPDTARLCSVSQIGDSMVPLAWSSISCACVDITEKRRRGMGLVGNGSQISSNTVHSAVAAGAARRLGSESVATLLGLVQVQGEPHA